MRPQKLLDSVGRRRCGSRGPGAVLFSQALQIQGFSAFCCRCHVAEAPPKVALILPTHPGTQRPEAPPQAGMPFHLLFPGPHPGNS